MVRVQFVVSGIVLVAASGCTSLVPPSNSGSDSATEEVVQKATEVAQLIGGPNGFGGTWMNGYMGHMPEHMGFRGSDDLADVDDEVIVELINGSVLPCSFHLAYLRGADGPNEQIEDADVEPGQTIDVTLPCAEILGLGSLEVVGAPAVVLEDGTQFSNFMSVPGFLNSDYVCGGVFTCLLTTDTNDLDGDGDTEELVAVTGGLLEHMAPDGFQQHMWSDSGIMMGGHGPMMGGSLR